MSARKARRPDLALPRSSEREPWTPTMGDRVYRVGETSSDKRADGSATILEVRTGSRLVVVSVDDPHKTPSGNLNRPVGWRTWGISRVRPAVNVRPAAPTTLIQETP